MFFNVIISSSPRLFLCIHYITRYLFSRSRYIVSFESDLDSCAAIESSSPGTPINDRAALGSPRVYAQNEVCFAARRCTGEKVRRCGGNPVTRHDDCEYPRPFSSPLSLSPPLYHPSACDRQTVRVANENGYRHTRPSAGF